MENVFPGTRRPAVCQISLTFYLRRLDIISYNIQHKRIAYGCKTAL